MAKVLEGHEVNEAASGKTRYPWNEWLDGQSRLIVAGEDYTSKEGSFSAMVRFQAKMRQLQVKVEKADTGLIITAYKEQVGDMSHSKKPKKAAI